MLSAAGCSKAPEALDMPSKTQSQAEQALPESGKRLDEIALPEAQTRQDQPVVTDQAEPEPDQTGAAAAEQAEPPAEDPITMEGKDMQITFDRLPDTLEELIKLPGVGRKTANVIQSVVFNKAAMAVDTHVFRVSHRIGLVPRTCTTPLATEKQLVKYIPEALIPTAHHWLILHGRYVCTARAPKCESCGLNGICKESLKSFQK